MTNNLWYPKQNPFLSLQSLGGGAAGYMISAGGGGTTVDFDGDDYLIVASSADLSFGTGDFAVEFWAYADDFGERGTFYDTRASSGTTGITIGHEQTTGEIRVYENATSGSDILLQSTDFDTGGWYHIAVTNSGGTLRLFINGIEKGSATARNLSNTNAVNIGYRTYTSSGYSYFDGKITNLRAVKGSAVYTAAFTPPSSALTNITNTKLLCCNQSSVTGKDVGPTITTSGDPTSSESTPFPFEPEYSVHFDGSNDRLSIADNTDFEFGSGDFTVEAWVKQPNQAGSGADSSTIVNKWHNTSGAKEWILRIDNGSGNNNLQWIQTTDGNSNQFTTGNTSLANDTWYHVAAVGDSGTIKLFVNGTQQSSTGTQGTINSYSNPLYFGYNLSSNGQWMDGEISNARIVKGQALYTSSFTAPTSPLTTTSQGATASNVKLLCCNKSSATDNTVAPSGLSDNESPTTGTATIGGTASTPYVDFDDADGLNVAADSNLSLGTGVFTIECWVYLDSAPGTGSPGYARVFQLDGPSGNSDQKNLQITINPTGGTLYTWAYDGSAYISIAGSTNLQGAWHHIAVVRDSSDVLTQYVDGSAEGNQSSVTKDFNPNSGSPRVRIGQYDTGGTNGVFNGKISNLRVLVGTALYTSNFTTPNPPLTNITNTELLCCQSSSSTTECTVGPIVTPVANGNPTAGAQTVAKSGTNTLDNTTITWPSTIKWNNNTLPTLVSNKRDSAFQIFHLTTGDTGASYQAWEEMKADTDTFGLWSWAYNGHGNLGVNDRTDRSSPVQVGTDVTWSSLTKTDTGGAAAIKSDGTLWLWGRQENGGSGQNEGGESDNYSSPTQIPGTTWSQISGGTENINSCWLATKTDGTMWGWGDNEYGNLGLNNKTQYSSPTQIGTDTTWSHTAGSATEFLAIKTDGTLWGLGRGWNGTLGNNLGGSNAARSSPTQVGTDSTWSSLGGSGQSAAAAVKTDGTLWTWGSNLIGGLGDNSRTSRSSPTQVGTDTTWSTSVKSIAGGYYGNAVIKTDGTLWAWGNNADGELGQNQANPARYSSPVQIPGTTWNSVKMSQYNVIATKTDGTLWAIGGNWYGELGQNQGGGSTIRRSSPVQIGTDTNWAQGDYALGGGARAIFALKEQ